MTNGEEFRVYMKAANRTSDSNAGRHLTEAEVIAFCRDEMSAAEHDAAEAHLVSCEQCIALFRNARDFLEPGGDDKQEITAAETDEAWGSLWQRVQSDGAVVPVDFQRARNKRKLSPVTLALAASLLISFAALAWVTWRLLSERESRRQSQEIAMQLENRQRELEQRLSQVEQQGSEQLKQERDQRLAAEAERDRLQERLSRQGSQDIPIYTAILSSIRGAEDDVRLRFPGATKAATLKLLISKPYEFPEYAVEIVDESGKIVSRASGLRPTGDDGALSFRVNRLNAGKYRLRLFGGKEKKQLGEYGVLVF
ncbi:MAG TPA: hypothetical protein VF290_20680 [Pyrinomonadaceae bacterium]